MGNIYRITNFGLFFKQKTEGVSNRKVIGIGVIWMLAFIVKPQRENVSLIK